MTRSPIVRLLVGVLLVTVLVYAWGNRSGRYQVTALDRGYFVVVDTSTGTQWLHLADNGNNLRFTEAEGYYSVPLRERLLW